MSLFSFSIDAADFAEASAAAVAAATSWRASAMLEGGAGSEDDDDGLTSLLAGWLSVGIAMEVEAAMESEAAV